MAPSDMPYPPNFTGIDDIQGGGGLKTERVTRDSEKDFVMQSIGAQGKRESSSSNHFKM